MFSVFLERDMKMPINNLSLSWSAVRASYSQEVTSANWIEFDKGYQGVIIKLFAELHTGTLLPNGRQVRDLFMRCIPRSGIGVLSTLANGMVGSKIKGNPPPYLELPEDLPEPLNKKEKELFDAINRIFKDSLDPQLLPSLVSSLILGESASIIRKYHDLNLVKLNAHVNFAAKYGLVEALRALKELGAGLDVKDDEGHTPAHIAGWAGQAEILRVLKELGMNLGTTNYIGNTPAHYAAIAGQVEVLRVLNELGVDLDATNNYGDSPVHVAALEGQFETFKVLKELGVNL